MSQKITPFLWFDNNAEEAIDLYTSVFEDSEVRNISRMGPGGPMPEGTVLNASFRLMDQEFMALNGGPEFQFTEATSFFISCTTQEEVDYYWERLTDGGGEPGRCGWLKDRFGLSWQVIPTTLGELMGSEDAAKSQAVMQAMLQMSKIEIAELQRAHDEA